MDLDIHLFILAKRAVGGILLVKIIVHTKIII